MFRPFCSSADDLSDETQRLGLVPRHIYAILGLPESDMVLLMNPWGFHGWWSARAIITLLFPYSFL